MQGRGSPWPCPKGLVHTLVMQFYTLGNSKIELFETYFFDTVMTQNDHPSYVKHASGRNIRVLYPTWVMNGLRRAPKGLVQNLDIQCFSLYS